MMRFVLCYACAAMAWLSTAGAADYHVGPGKPLASIGAVPWATLNPGDRIFIWWRAEPYREKWVVARSGTPAAPILIYGVRGPQGQPPSIDGENAVTAPGLNYWGEERGVVKVGGANIPSAASAAWVTIENLEFRNASNGVPFTGDDGTTRTFTQNASGIYLERGSNITVRNCVFRDNGNGLFVASSGSTVSSGIVVERNYIYNNGNAGSIYEHNVYTAALGITFQYNRFGPLRAGAGGNNLKDRSAGTVIRYNWIEGGNRQLDLVDDSDTSVLYLDPRYQSTYVYGNVLIELASASDNKQMIHYGGDSGDLNRYRKGTLYLYHNTFISGRPDGAVALRLSSNSEAADVRNNIFFMDAAGGTLAMLDSAGVVEFQSNWMKPGWRITNGTLTGAFHNHGGHTEAADPGFVSRAAEDFRLSSGSSAVDRGSVLHPAVLPVHEAARQYVKHQSLMRRLTVALPDLGAYEWSSAGWTGNTQGPCNTCVRP